MNRLTGVLLIIVLLATIPGVSYSADIARIGVIDFQRILKSSKAGKDVAKQLRQKQEERRIALKEKQKEIITLQKNMKNADLLEEKESRDAKQAELDSKLEAFKKLEAEFSSALKEINSTASSRIRKDVSDLITAVGKKGGYLLIVEKSDVLYAPDAVDITEKIIKAYDKKYSGR